jgi:hypothetical protein
MHNVLISWCILLWWISGQWTWYLVVNKQQRLTLLDFIMLILCLCFGVIVLILNLFINSDKIIICELKK